MGRFKFAGGMRMQTLVIRTKLQIPLSHPDTLPRQRLWHQLSHPPTSRLTLVSAPAGYGKSTLIAQWALAQADPVAWFSIDEADNDPVRFFTYLVATLHNIDQNLGQTAVNMMQATAIPLTGGHSPAQNPFVSPLTSLVEDLAAVTAPITLVLDDYHLIQAEPVHEMIRFLITHQPDQLHLIISTRVDPPLNLARLRARGQISEVTEVSLSFTAEETAAFLHDQELATEQMAELTRRTEGWAAGLRLAALSLTAYESTDAFMKSFSGNDRQIADYLFEEVFALQSADMQDFLLRTSILSRLNGPLCDALLAESPQFEPSQTYLDKLDTAQLFLIALDNKRGWYRYHHLLADFLQARLEQSASDLLPNLHLRASQWYEETGDITAAVTHAFAIPDVERVIHLLEQQATLMIYTGQIVTYLGWLERLPQEAVFQHPYLCADAGWAYALLGQIEAAERFVQAGKAALPQMKPLFIALRQKIASPDEVLGDLLSIQAFCARMRGDSAAVMHYSEEALQRLPSDATAVRSVVALNLGLEYFHQWRWAEAQSAFAESFKMTLNSGENIYVGIVALAMQGTIHTRLGAFKEAQVVFHQALDLGREEAPATVNHIPAICLGYRGLAEILFHQHKLTEAADHLETAAILARQTGNVDIEHTILRLKTSVAIQNGDVLLAKATYNEAVRQLTASGRADDVDDLTALQCELWLAQSQPRPAIALLAENEITPTTVDHLSSTAAWGEIPLYLWLAQALIQVAEVEAADQLLTALLPLVETGQDLATRIWQRLLTAVLLSKQGNEHRSREALTAALDLAAPGHFVSPFLNLPHPVYDLLRQMKFDGTLPADDFALKLLAILAGRLQKEAELLAARPATPAGGALTRQETQVLLLLDQGLSSTQVASELVIAVSTARSYIKNIYRKLDVHSRPEALARARELGLL